MFDTLDGIPLHPLVVHAIVVLLPLSILGTIAIAVRPSWRLRYGHLVVAAAAVATVLCPVATSSGEEFEKRVGDPGEHAELGDTLLWFALALLVFSAALVFLAHRDRHAARAAADAPPDLVRPTGSRGAAALPTVVAVLAVVAGLAAGVQVYRVGESGARAAWGDVGSIEPKG